jgi:hypothetical protein
MKTRIPHLLRMVPRLLAAGLGALAVAVAQPRVVTIVHTTSDQTNTVRVAPFETVKVLWVFDALSVGQIHFNQSGAQIVFGTWGYYTAGSGPSAQIPVVLAGPAEITITSGNSQWRDRQRPQMVTLEISPAAYPVNQAVTVGPGWGGAAITLEASPDLVEWNTTTNGVYSNLEDPRFFRIKVERLQ